MSDPRVALAKQAAQRSFNGETLEGVAEAVIAAVEPMIRQDEAEQWLARIGRMTDGRNA